MVNRLSKYPLYQEGGNTQSKKISPFEGRYIPMYDPNHQQLLVQGLAALQNRHDVISEAKNKTIFEVGNMETTNPEFIQGRLDILKADLNKITEDYDHNLAYAATTLSRRLAEETGNPIYALNRYQVEQHKRKQAHEDKFGANLITLNDPLKHNIAEGASYEDLAFKGVPADDYLKIGRELIGNPEKLLTESGLTNHPTIAGLLQNVTTKGLSKEDMIALLEIPEVVEAFKAAAPTLSIDNREGYEWTKSDEGIKNFLMGILAKNIGQQVSISTTANPGGGSPATSNIPPPPENPPQVLFDKVPLPVNVETVQKKIDTEYNKMYEEYFDKDGNYNIINTKSALKNENLYVNEKFRGQVFKGSVDVSAQKTVQSFISSKELGKVLISSYAKLTGVSEQEVYDNPALTKEILQTMQGYEKQYSHYSLEAYHIPGIDANGIRKVVGRQQGNIIVPGVEGYKNNDGKVVTVDERGRMGTMDSTYAQIFTNNNVTIYPETLTYVPGQGTGQFRVKISMKGTLNNTSVSHNVVLPASIFPEETQKDIESYNQLMKDFVGTDSFEGAYEVNGTIYSFKKELMEVKDNSGKSKFVINPQMYIEAPYIASPDGNTPRIDLHSLGKFKENLAPHLYELDFLNEVEEGVDSKGNLKFSYTPYIPKDSSGNVIGQSGVTVGVGVDLGQQSVVGLYQMGVSQQIVQKLSPFIGKKTSEADLALKNNSWNLSEEEVQELTYAVQNFHINSLNSRFGDHFKALNAPARSVLLSLSYHYGPNSFTSNPGVRAVTRDLLYYEFEEAAKKLEVLDDRFPSRRRKEAAKLRKAKLWQESTNKGENIRYNPVPLSEPFNYVNRDVLQKVHVHFGYDVKVAPQKIDPFN